MKNARHEIILRAIKEHDIESQNQLIEALAAEGVVTTQATISRDIKELRLIKELTSKGTYRYTTAPSEVAQHSDRLKKIFVECVVSVERAQNIVVIKTLPGLASAACSAVEGMDIKKLVGTVAGDDTAFLAMTDNVSAENLIIELRSYF